MKENTLINTTDSRVAQSAQIAAQKIGSPYLLVLAASARVRELRDGAAKKVITTAGRKITALQEIEAGLVGPDYVLKHVEQIQRQQLETKKQNAQSV